MKDYNNKNKERENFINSIKKWEKEANESVLGFIFDFVWCKTSNINEYELIRSLFMDGYCYYFAVILKTAFNRGEICWCAPYAHFIWLDTNGIPYDIEGVSTAEANYYIPEAYITDGIADFKHVPGVEFGATKEYIDNAIKMYEKNIKKED